ncbi:MAG: hypothetical protein IIY93_01545 [Clostridia bacterium]|nr:hypothetical protein [Clostridia bacterium]MBQ1554357.1 hypothetical protein [Clostridia bacterium]MBQ4397861.1 hypothetical protein [Clostridia bacterium]
MTGRNQHLMKGIGLGMLLGAAVGAAGFGSVCGMPSKRKLRRRLMNAADNMGSALEDFYNMIR